VHHNESDSDDEETERGVSTDADPHGVSLSLDTVLSLLADHRRRDLLQHLREQPDRPASVEECVEFLVEQEAERIGDRPDPERVETALHHVHVPKMVDTGILDYDHRSQVLRYWSNDRLEAWLDRIRAVESESD
jgi:hypothetical protein